MREVPDRKIRKIEHLHQNPKHSSATDLNYSLQSQINYKTIPDYKNFPCSNACTTLKGFQYPGRYFLHDFLWVSVLHQEFLVKKIDVLKHCIQSNAEKHTKYWL